jgi:ectoine hydroxylase-related dioxygenase (phytanoyl-CoA dioxygenase family)
MVVKDAARSGVGGDRTQLERLADAGYEKGAQIPEGFDEHDDPYLSIPAYVDRLDEAWEDVKRLGLERHALELQTLGFTAVEPDLIGPPEFIQDVLHATLEVAKRRRGIDYNFKNGAPELNLYGRGADKAANEKYILLESDKFLLFEDPIYEKIVQNEAVLALVTLLIGRGCLLDRLYSLYRHANTLPLPLHTETGHMSPFPSFPTLASVTWCLTDFKGIADGATCYVPGTHKFNRRPTKHEGYVAMSSARSVNAPAGSVLLHNGATWHGAPTRLNEGIRVSVNMFYIKGNLPQSEGYRGREPEGILERNPARFAHLLGHSLTRGHGEEGYGLEKRGSSIETSLL